MSAAVVWAFVLGLVLGIVVGAVIALVAMWILADLGSETDKAGLSTDRKPTEQKQVDLGTMKKTGSSHNGP